MSASSKKKLRAAENAEKLTEKQLAEQKEAKKLKIFTIIMVVAVVLMAVFAVWTGITRTIANSGIRERNTVALTVGEHKISNAELNYFYIDYINNFYSQYGSYISLFGLDLTQPLDEQYVDEESGTTWADDFLDAAMENAKVVYALTDEAKANGYTVPEADLAQIESTMSYMGMYAAIYGYSDTETYLKAMYGNGATEESLREYYELTLLADSYASHYNTSLTFTDDEISAAQAENYNQFSSYSYNTYYLSVSKFYEGGTTGEDGTTTYSDEEKAAAAAAAEEAAKSLTDGSVTTVEELDAAIAALSINAESTSAASSAYTDNSYSGISALYSDWVTDDSRTEGDMTYVASTSTSTDDEGKEVTTTNGYYVVYFVGSNNNEFALKNVRHILAAFEGGTTDDSGNTTYSDDEKAAAQAEAEELLSQWKAGDATEDSFAALANENSDDGDGTTGGLYENVYPNQMVTNFNDWCYDANRQTGDTEVIETEYGYHVMYFVGDSDMTYRVYQITEELRSEAYSEWYNALVEGISVTEGTIKYIDTDLVLSAS